MNVEEAIELCNAYIEPNIHPSRRLSIDKDFMELITVLEECKKQEAKIKQFHEMLLVIQEGYEFVDNVTGLLPEQSTRYEQICALLFKWEELEL